MTRNDIRVGQIYNWGNYDGGRYEVISIETESIIFKRCDDNTIVDNPYPIRNLLSCIVNNECTLEGNVNVWSLSRFRFV